MRASLAVVDPALGPSKGHHAGFAEMLAADRPDDVEVTYFTHLEFSDREVDRLQKSGIAVFKSFSQIFYQHFAARVSSSNIMDYIMTMAKEYIRVFRQIESTRKPHIFLHHTLNWEHANALSLALQLTNQRMQGNQHKVLLMFNSGINHLGDVTEPLRCLNFRLALKKMIEMPHVDLLASCKEYSEAYNRLLDCGKAITIHPNLFAKNNRVNNCNRSNNLANGNILLYFGDAKVEKGFGKLPERIQWFLRQCGSGAKLILQYNCGRNGSLACLQDVEDAIKRLAEEDSRVHLHKGFWSNDTIQHYFRMTDLMLLDYDKNTYAEKTSGLLWLASAYRIPIITTEETWALRESRHLGLPSTTWAKKDSIRKIAGRLDDTAVEGGDTEYAKQIQMSFWEWFENW